MLNRLITQIRNLDDLHRFLVIAAIIAFPVDIVALAGLLLPITRFQQVNPLSRPNAAQIGLPSFLWDTRIADILTLTILFFSTIVLWVLSYSWNLASAGLFKQKELEEKIDREGGREEYIKRYKAEPTPQPLNEDDIFIAILWAAMIALSLVLPVFLMWLRVFVMTRELNLSLPILVLIGLILFNFLFLMYRTGRLAYDLYDGDIFEQNLADPNLPKWNENLLLYTLFFPIVPIGLAGDFLPNIYKKLLAFLRYDPKVGWVEFITSAIGSLLILLAIPVGIPFFLLSIPAALFVGSITALILGWANLRLFKVTLLISPIFFIFLILLRAQGIWSWGWSILLSCSIVVLIPLLWGCMVSICFLLSHLIRFLLSIEHLD